MVVIYFLRNDYIVFAKIDGERKKFSAFLVERSDDCRPGAEQNGYLKNYLRLDVIVCYVCYGFWGRQKGKRAKIRCFWGSTSDFCYPMLSYVPARTRLLTEGL